MIQQTLFLLILYVVFNYAYAEPEPPKGGPQPPPPPEKLVEFVMKGFDADSNFAINLEELEVALSELHKNRPQAKPRPESGEARPPRRGPPPLLELFQAVDLNQDNQLQEYELLFFFEDFERAHRANRDGRHGRHGLPPPGGAQK